MHVHRVLVDSALRIAGHPFDFSYDVSRLSTDQDFLRGCHMAAVEMTSPIFYSEYQTAFAPNEDHPNSLLLTWDRPAANIYGQQNALLHLQQYEDLGIYGLTADSPYISRRTLGVILQGDTLNKAGVLRFRVLQESDDGFTPCQAPQNNVIFGDDFRFMLVFWSYPKPENPLAHDFYRLILDTGARVSGSAADCLVPVSINTNGSMRVLEDTWMVVVESISLLKTTSVSAGLTLRSETFRSSSAYDGNVLGFFPRSSIQSKANYGQRLSIKQTTRDTIGAVAKVPLDQLSAIHLSVRTSEDAMPELLDDFIVCLTVYKT